MTKKEQRNIQKEKTKEVTFDAYWENHKETAMLYDVRDAYGYDEHECYIQIKTMND